MRRSTLDHFVNSEARLFLFVSAEEDPYVIFMLLVSFVVEWKVERD